MPKYEALRLIRHGDEKGKIYEIEPGKIVVLTEEAAAPLLDCGALKAAEAVEKNAGK